MEKLVLAARQTRKSVNVLFAIALSTVILVNFVLDESPELFQEGAEIGQVLANLSLAYMASYIFYLIVVKLKHLEDQEQVRPYIATKTYNIIGDGRSIIRELRKAVGKDATDNMPIEEEINDICTNINIYDAAPLMMSIHDEYANWMQFIEYHKNRSQRFIREVLTLMPFLDAGHIRLLTAIDNCTLFSLTENMSFMMQHTTLKNRDLTVISKYLADYFSLIDQLETYADSTLEQYYGTERRK